MSPAPPTTYPLCVDLDGTVIANRGELHSDPIVFALKDGPSYAVGAATALIVWLATI